ncbi:MAG TPA: NlpC/P60 family protein, partial [Jatrophihabitans sp.]|nr:NlpC/P60 family protein [Jatrophihabitans sp.]
TEGLDPAWCRAAAAAARAAAAAARHHAGSSPSVAAFVPNPGRSAPASGHWTRAEAKTAVRRAMSTLGTPYAWAGGDASGPTYGVCVTGDAWNDCHVYGYDCSGLVMYAWGPYLSLAHFAATQYHQAGSYHPGAGNLRAGDLVFWSDTGSWQDIHHVAIYIGGGQIIEAPYSGGYVQIASLYEYGSGFFTTRPLT